MSIEQNLARIADALEKLAAAGTLTTVVAQVEDTSAKDAEEAVKKAATKGRGKKADPTPEPEVTEDTPPAAAKPEVKEEAPVVVTINVTDVQKRAAKLAAAHGKDNIFKLIGRQGTDKISAHTAEQLVALNTAFDQLEAGDEELMAFLKGEEAFD